MSGLVKLVSRIRDDINRGSDFDARIKQAIEDSIFYYRNVRLGFNTKRKTFVVAAEYVSLTANWIETDYITLERSSYRNALTEKTFHWVNEQNADPNYSSEPIYYAIQNRQLRLFPSPDQSYSVQMSYLYDLQNVSLSASDSASNAWTNEARNLIQMHSAIDLLENYIDGPEAQAKAARLRIRETDELKQLKRRANREQGSGMIEPFL
jgi:hypothetical protein